MLNFKNTWTRPILSCMISNHDARQKFVLREQFDLCEREHISVRSECPVPGEVEIISSSFSSGKILESLVARILFILDSGMDASLNVSIEILSLFPVISLILGMTDLFKIALNSAGTPGRRNR